MLRQAQHCRANQQPLSRHYAVLDTTHGRCGERRIEVFAAPPELAHSWPEIAAFVAVQRCGWREGDSFCRDSWFLLTDILPAATAAQLIQEHRATIENRLHWVKDVVQQEDASEITAPPPALLMALLRTWAISAFRKAGHRSLTQAIRRFQHDLTALLSFL